jgi:hypothetical protein
MSDKNIQNKIQTAQDNYYKDHTKHLFFKKTQKLDCANKVIDEVGLNDLIEKTMYYQEGTNIIWLNYAVFKTFATDEVCDKLTNYFIELLEYGKKYYNKVDIKLNLDKFTITGLERYKHFIEMSMNRLSDKYDNVVETCFIINAPYFTNQLIGLFSSIIGQQRFSTMQTKLMVINKE